MNLKRIAFTIASATSLLLLLLVLALWVRSWFVGDLIETEHVEATASSAYRAHIVWTSARGVLQVYRVAGSTTHPAMIAAQQPNREVRHHQYDAKTLYAQNIRSTRFGFALQRTPSDAMFYLRTNTGRISLAGPSSRVAVPYALPAMLLAIAPAVWLVKWRRRRAPDGVCAKCGYDLRATPERCPECGHKPATPVEILA